jgi:hypothetical protein
LHSLAPAKVYILCKLTGVRHYDDVFEKLIRRHADFEGLGVLFRRRISPLVRKKRILFIHVPKNAGTSISKALYGCSLGHMTAYLYRQADAQLFGTALRFAILRDPVDRFLSAFSFIQNGGGEDVVVEPGFAAVLKKLNSIDSILDFIEKNMSDIYQIDNVLRPQSWYLMDNSGNLIIENIFVLGFHDKELSEFLNALNVSNLQVLNRTRREEITLTPSQLERVRAIYRLDISLLEQVKRHGPALSEPFSARGTAAWSGSSNQSFSGCWI